MIIIEKIRDTWFANFRYDEAVKDRVKAAGFRWNPISKKWWTQDQNIAASFCNGAAHTAATPHAATSDLDIPAPSGLTYLPYQKAGVEFAMARKDTLIADQMGLGKTIQAIGLININPAIKSVLVVCPASLRLNWEQELRKWLVRRAHIHVGTTKCFPITGDEIVICSYQTAVTQQQAIRMVAWDLLIVDEAHAIKNPKAKRTHAIVGSKLNSIPEVWAKQRLFLTGTPVLNRPKELWTIVQACCPDGLGYNWHQFHMRYCQGHQERIANVTRWNVDGASNLGELQERLRASIMIRRRKEDVLKDLPPKRRQIITLPVISAETAAAIEAENKAGKELEELRAQVEALSVDEASEEYKKTAAKLREVQAVAFTMMSTMRKRVALAKTPQVLEHLKDALESEDKIVVFAWHKEVVDAIVDGLADYGVVKIYGDTPERQRAEAKKAFQEAVGVRVIVGTIGAMGEGHTLTAASYVAFAELDWTPARLEQAEDRLHRIGQKNSILVQHLVLQNSFDARLVKTIMSKMDVISRVVD